MNRSIHISERKMQLQDPSPIAAGEELADNFEIAIFSQDEERGHQNPPAEQDVEVH